jgi:hypothetical protein
LGTQRQGEDEPDREAAAGNLVDGYVVVEISP